MKSTTHNGTTHGRPKGIQSCWAYLCLALALLAFSLMEYSDSTYRQAAKVQFAEASDRLQSTCGDHHQAIEQGHCHSVGACFGFSQMTENSVGIDGFVPLHPIAGSASKLDGRTLQPSLQPPNDSIQA